MDSGFDDSELARAIAQSLKETSGRPSQAPDDDEYEDEDELYQQQLKQAIEMSQAETKPSVAPVAGQPNPFLAERARLEQERLQRQNKRLRRDDSSNENIMESSAPTAKRPNLTSLPPSQSPTPGPATPTIQEGDLFWDGELRPTANEFCIPRNDGRATFRLTDILGKKDQVAFAIISSYVLDFDFTYNLFDPSVPVILVTQPSDSGRADIKNILPTWVKTTPYVATRYACMHMKFMLLFYKTGRLRVIIPTANLVRYDWRQIENFVWLQDLPLRSGSDQPRLDKEAFPILFQRVLHALNVRPALETMIKQDNYVLPLQSIEELTSKWDWSKVKVHLVPSIAGKHEGWPKVILTGHTRLMKVVRNLGLKVGESRQLSLECQGSSIGTYTAHWMNEFYWSARGQNGTRWLDKPKKSREKLPYPPIKVLFPSKRTVQDSRLGERGGGTMFCRREQWAATKFPRHLFHDSRSRGGPVLMHTKMILGLVNNKSGRSLIAAESDESTDDENVASSNAIGWLYVGSHNFTPSAWGNLSGSSFTPVMNISNYELGIVFPLKNQQEVDRMVVWERPPPAYGSQLEPWIQKESVHLQSDS